MGVKSVRQLLSLQSQGLQRPPEKQRKISDGVMMVLKVVLVVV